MCETPKQTNDDASTQPLPPEVVSTIYKECKGTYKIPIWEWDDENNRVKLLGYASTNAWCE